MRTLLVADDSTTIRRVVEHAFASTGVRVLAAASRDEALRLARAERPDVLLCGVLLPGGSGYDIAHALAHDPVLGRTRTLLLTGAFEPFDEARAAACGAVGFVTKPFESAALRQRVLALMGGGQADGPPVAATPERVGGRPGPPGGPMDEIDEPFGPLGPPAPELPVWAAPPVALPGDEHFHLGFPHVPPPAGAGTEGSDVEEGGFGLEGTSGGESRIVDATLRDEIHRQIAALAPGIVRQLVLEVAWEVLPDLLDRALRRTAAEPGEPAIQRPGEGNPR